MPDFPSAELAARFVLMLGRDGVDEAQAAAASSLGSIKSATSACVRVRAPASSADRACG
jgi:hypothetical protein